MKKKLLILFLVMFLIGTDTFLVSPLLPTLTEVYHISTRISGWMVGTYSIGYALFALVSGPLSDRINRKKIMICGLVAFSMSTCACGFASSFCSMLFWRFMAGISASFVGPQVWAFIPSLFPIEGRVKAMGYASAGLSISQLVGIPIGSYLAIKSWHIPFWVIASLALVITVMVVLSFPNIKTIPDNNTNNSFIQKYKEIYKTPGIVKYLFAYFVFQTATFTSFTFVGTWFSKDFGLMLGGVGTAMIAIGLGNTIGSIYGNRIVHVIGENRTVSISIPCLGIMYMILPFIHNIFIAEILLVIIFFVNGCTFPILMDLLQSFTQTARGTLSSLANSAMYVGTSIGGIIGGILFSSKLGFIAVAYFTGIVYLIARILFSFSGVFKLSEVNKN